jgi:hypothetical protein
MKGLFPYANLMIWCWLIWLLWGFVPAVVTWFLAGAALDAARAGRGSTMSRPADLD